MSVRLTPADGTHISAQGSDLNVSLRAGIDSDRVANARGRAIHVDVALGAGLDPESLLFLEARNSLRQR